MVADQFALERQKQISDRLSRDGRIRSAALADEFGVAIETIRRDIKELEQRGALRRQHGGAISTARSIVPPVSLRMAQQQRAKEQIARLARSLVSPGDHVFLAGSSTTLALAWALRSGPKASYTSNMIDIVSALGTGEQDDVTLIGGRFSPDTHTLDGYETLELMQRRQFDLAFVSVSGITLERGYLGPRELHTVYAKTIRSCAERLVILATAEKFGRNDKFSVLRPDEVNVIVTERQPSIEYYRMLERSNTKIVFEAPASGQERGTKLLSQTERARPIRRK